MGYDAEVVVIGGGPAGSATAIALARRGVAVAVLASSRRGRTPVGETAASRIAEPLTRLGVYETFLSDGHVPAPGTVVCWGGDEPFETESITDPYGPAWHLDRDRFDAMLLDAAARAGARVCEATGFARVVRDERGVRAVVADPYVLRAPMLFDATGRPARVALRHGADRRREDRLIGLVSFGAARSDDHRTVIEACEHGWWYAARLPRGRAVAAFMTDADLLPTAGADRARLWERALTKTILVREVMEFPPGPPRLRAAPASTGALSTCAGADWIAVGDAARTVDPLSGLGVTHACRSALDAVDALVDLGRGSALRRFSLDNLTAHRRDVRTGLDHYRRETRWPRSPFWVRRHRRSREMSRGEVG